MTEETSARAKRIHEESLVVDALSAAEMFPLHFTQEMVGQLEKAVASHAPTYRVFELAREMFDEAFLAGGVEEYWEWVDRSGVDVAHTTVGVDGPRPWTYANAVRDLARWTALFDGVERFAKVRSVDDFHRARAARARGIILGFQNCDAIGSDLERLAEFHRFGIRVVQLTYNGRNLLGDGCLERTDAGLSSFGIAVVRAMNDLGMLVDLSHCGERTSLDAIETSASPVAVTHGFARAVNDHPRGKSDAVIRALADAGGFFGVCLVPYFLTSEPEATLGHFVDHVRHVVDLAGVEHVGIGTDQAGIGRPEFPRDLLMPDIGALVRDVGFREEHNIDLAASVEGYETWREWPNLTAALVDAGFDDREVGGLIGGNFLRVFGSAVG